MNKFSYNNLLRTRTENIWARIGIKRRAGVVIPLFSIFSHESIGIGEIPDLKLVIDWCVKTGMSIIQLLPLNETGIDFAPYNAISSFALEPMYLKLTELKGTDINTFKQEITPLKKKFNKNKTRVDYRIKRKKLKLLWKIFLNTNTDVPDFHDYVNNNRYWLTDYAVFKLIKESKSGKMWEKWAANYRKSLTKSIEKKNLRKVQFLYWIQWQLFEQMKAVKVYAVKNDVLLMGDLPFLTSRDSADVWAHQKYFKLNLSAGAPPDMYFAFGQKWGMPPYNWNEIEKDNYVYIKEKLKYAENFYDMYRIDHFVGLFRIWTTKTSLLSFQNKKGSENQAPAGKFDPEQEDKWENHGKKIINVMLHSSSMLPCGEDLGTVPECSNKTLREYGIPGIDFQRFNKNKKYEFIPHEKYRINSSSVISTHDSSFFPLWWKHEAGTIDKKLFLYLCSLNNIKGNELTKALKLLFDKTKSRHGRLFWNKSISESYLLKILKLSKDQAKGILKLYNETFGEKEKFLKLIYGKYKPDEKPSPPFQHKCLKAISTSSSIFSVQLLHEYLYLDKKMFGRMNKWSYRINQPGSENYKNWSIIIPCSLEELLRKKSLNSKIMNFNKKADRS